MVSALLICTTVNAVLIISVGAGLLPRLLVLFERSVFMKQRGRRTTSKFPHLLSLLLRIDENRTDHSATQAAPHNELQPRRPMVATAVA